MSMKATNTKPRKRHKVDINPYLLLAPALIIMICIGVSIPFAFGAVLIYYFVIMGGTPSTTISVGFSQLNSLVLLAIPMFVIAGGVIEKGKIGDALVNFIDMFVGHIKGGLGAVSVVTSAIFGAITGSCAACLSCIGSIMYPKLRKAGYDEGFATALLVNAGPLGLLIPPSADQILYAWSAGLSVLACFLSSEGIKNYKLGYAWLLAGLGIGQIVRIFVLPAQAHATELKKVGRVMADGQYTFVVVCLVVSAVCCLAAALIGGYRSVVLKQYQATLETKSA